MKTITTLSLILLFSFMGLSQTVTYNGCTIYTGNDPNTGVNVDELQLPRSMWVNEFFMYDPQLQDEPADECILCNGNWNGNSNLYEDEEAFLDYVTQSYQSQGATVSRLLLYNISFILDPLNNTVSVSGGPSLTLEEHLARFIAVAKSQYNLEIEAVIPGGTNSKTNAKNAYDFTLGESTLLQNLDDFQPGDPCLNPPGHTHGKTNVVNSEDWIYFDESIHGTIYPVDDDGNLHPFDEIRKGIWNVRVFNSRNDELKSTLAGALSNFTEWQPTCLGFDRVVPEWEYWDDMSAQNTGLTYIPNGTSSTQPIYKINDAWDGLLTLLSYGRCSSDLLEDCGFAVDAWVNNFSSYADNGNPYPAYLMFDNNNQIIDPYTTNINKNMAQRIEWLSDDIYVGAYKNTPCKAYYSSGSSSMRTFKYRVGVFNQNNTSSRLIPVFNTKIQNNSLNTFLKASVTNDGFDGSFGKAESVFYDEYINSAPAGGWGDQLIAYSWYNRDEAFANQFYKMEAKEQNVHHSVFKFYPNPANGSIQVETNELGKELRICNIAGQTVIQTEISTYRYQIDLLKLPHGVYFIQVGNRVEKLVLN